MPKELWDAAVAAAHEHGVWAVSRALRVNYESLRGRIEGETRDGRSETGEAGGFVELDGLQILGAAERAGAVVELSRPDGAKMTMRLEGAGARDVVALADAFWRAER